MTFSRMLASLLAATAAVGALTGCSATVSLEPADLANDPACAAVSVRLPDTVDGLSKRTTDAQATAAWGEPAAAILRCGLAPVEVSSLKCVTTSDVDWLVDDSKAPSYRFITFARKPAVEVIIDSNHAVGVNVLDDVAAAVKHLPASKRCG